MNVNECDNDDIIDLTDVDDSESDNFIDLTSPTVRNVIQWNPLKGHPT